MTTSTKNGRKKRTRKSPGYASQPDREQLLQEIETLRNRVHDLEAQRRAPSSAGRDTDEQSPHADPPTPGKLATAQTVDITDPKRPERSPANTQEEVRLSEERFRTALRNAPVTVYNQDRDLKYMWAFNPRGIESTNLLGEQAAHIVPQFPPELDALKRRVLETGIGTRQETSGTGLDGGEHFYDVTIDPLHNPSDAVIGITTTAIDITEYKQALNRIQQLNRELEKRATALEIAIKELESFSFSVSHDLRTPLATIDGFARVLEEDHGAQLSAQAQRYLGHIRLGARQMDELIQSLLDLSRLSRHALLKQPVNMSELVIQAMVTLQQEPRRQDLTIEFKELPSAYADPVLLKQVWVNLISNALKFTRSCENARIEIGCEACDGEERVYYVRDNGVGFDMEQEDRLFGIFQRLHGEHEYEGTGVGLAIVRRIIHRHGGRVWAEAQVNQGATFFFTLDSREPRT